MTIIERKSSPCQPSWKSGSAADRAAKLEELANIYCCECGTNLGEIAGRVRKDCVHICKKCMEHIRGDGLFKTLFGGGKK